MVKPARSLAPLWVALAALVLVTACAGGTTGSPRDAGAGAGRRVRGGNLVRAINYGDPGNLDPAAKSEVAAQMVTMNVFSRLVRYNPVAAKVEPDLAERWEVGDGTHYTFTLRSGATFHDGRPVTASDVKYSFERVVDPKTASPAANAFVDVVGAVDFREGRAPGIAGVTTEGDSVVRIALTRLRPTFLMTLTSVPSSVVPKAQVARLGADFGMRPVGSGPFRLESWTRDDRIVLRAYPRYFGGRPYLDRVTYRIMKEEATRDAEFQTGKLDMMTVGEATYRRYRDDPRYRGDTIEVPELFTRAIFFNLKEEPFDDVRVRRALNHAVDKKLVVEKILEGKAYPATGPLPASSPGFDKALAGYGHDPARARALLAEAGLSGGFEMEVLATAAGARILEGLSAMLADVGARLKIVQLESTTLLERTRSGSFKAAYFSTGGDADPVDFLEARLHSRNIGKAGNVTSYRNPEVDRLLDEAQATTDQARRIELARRAQALVVDDAPWFFFNYNKAVVVHQPWVEGLRPVPTDIDFQDMSKVWLSEDRPR